MKILSYQASGAASVAAFFRKIFLEMGWTERSSDYMDAPHLLFHLPDKGLLMVVKEGENVVGTAGIIFLSEKKGVIKRFYIDQTHRGSGIANKLLQSLEKEAQRVGIHTLILDVRKTNLRAIRFYEKNGFSKTTVTPQNWWPESKTPDTHAYYCKQIGGHK